MSLQLVRGTPRGAQSPCVVTIGAFDGLHVGHQALIARTLARARESQVPSVLLSFEPMPREFLSPKDPPARLTNLRERWRLLEHSGLDRLQVLTFNDRLRSLSGRDFMELLHALGARAVIVGHDFRFGRGAEASAEWFAAESSRYGYEVEVVAAVPVGDERASSGLVRTALAANDLPRAAAMLGRAYTMRGRVAHGNQLGRKLGFPTANLPLHRRRAPLAGIYATRVSGAGCTSWPSVGSLGTRPMVGGVVPILEVHLFDFDRDIYDQELEVEFVAHLREERRFESLDAMVVQMHRDAAEARAILARVG
ncbi:MAG TPA: bifunctional riboflavin kinase/FAD synthetase [Steroidobacteraceae bacterium]|nr:bifunctional riboflavin kinase/FAD synthetase [Steroidobacteraceae bacterium]